MNHCLNDSGFTQFEGYIQLLENGEYLKITNKIPNPKYHITMNSKELKVEQKRYREM